MSVRVVENHVTGCLEVYVYERRGEKRFFYWYDAQDGWIEEDVTDKQMVSSNSLKVSIQIKGGMVAEFVRAFVDYAKKNGIKSSDENYTAGKLEATQSHLNDLRSILKLEKR